MVTKTPETMAREIVAREGGFVNDPDDRGGATKFGVTIGTMRRLGMDLDGDGDVDVADVHALTVEEAVKLYLDKFFRAPRIDRLPVSVQASVFDQYVHSGSWAISLFQDTLNEIGVESVDLKVDGRLGPFTIGAAHRAEAAVGADGLRDIYGIARRNRYYCLADDRAKNRKYARRRDGGKGGWITRAEEFISERFHLTAAEHRARVSAWG